MGGREPFSYDVFLSFSGADTRLGFTGNLNNALSQRGIHSFFDDKEIRKGEEITPALVKAIEGSTIAIVVLSKNYAFSTFCLDELATILKCFDEKKVRVVLPVFYDVDPSYVRHGRGSYGEALAKHEERFKDNKEKVDKWRIALTRAANLSGFHFKHGHGYEYQFIAGIIKEVSLNINRTLLYVADHPVGLKSRVDKVIPLLNLESDDEVIMVGIYGIGGIGKSTIARAVYNFIGDHFEGFCCFLEDMRKNTVRHGLEHLQEMVLYEILGDNHTKLGNTKKGMSIIKNRLCTKKVLLVLDDVDEEEQLKAIAGAPDWFGPGSRVIITTRGNGLLNRHGVKRTYEVEGLEHNEACELLCWNAFRTETDKVDSKYSTVLNRAVAYASKLPLALEVIGSNLFEKGEAACSLILDQYDRIPDEKIGGILRVSFDSLAEYERKVFLDIAWCFGGYKLSDVENILHAHYHSPMRRSIELLVEKSLIKIDDDLVTLHELIRDMGREVERSQKLSKRSRLWFSGDVNQFLEEIKGTSKIHILVLDFPKGEEVNWDEVFKKMTNLKTLVVRNGHFSKGPTHLPSSLRVLKWQRYPSSSLPCYFHPTRLYILELPESCLKPCEPLQAFAHLRILDFSNSEYITEIPDVSGVQNLEKLSFKHCDNLTKIHKSVGYLRKLKILDVANCKNLKTFPPIILISLEQLNLSHCPILESFPDILGKMENIKDLHIIGSPIKKLPFSIEYLTRLQKLELQNCGMVQLPSSIVMMPELSLIHVSICEGLRLSEPDEGKEVVLKSSTVDHLILSYCSISDDFLPIGLTLFSKVKDLNLSGNNFTNLHACIKECDLLRSLKLDDCGQLQEIKGIPGKLEILSVKGCRSLGYLDLTVLPACTAICYSLKELILDDCLHLREIIGLPPNLDHFSAKNCSYLTSQSISMSLNQEWVEARNKLFLLPGKRVPQWFPHVRWEGSISFWFRNKFPAISLCLVIKPVDVQPITVKFSPRLFISGKKRSLGSQKVYEFKLTTDHLLLLTFEDNLDVVFSDSEWKRVEVSYADHITNNEVPIKDVAAYCGIHVFEQSSNGPGNIQFTDPSQPKLNVILDPNSMQGPRQTVKITTERPQKDQTTVSSSTILATQPPTAETKRPFEDVKGETSQRPPEDEAYPAEFHNDPPVNERRREREGDDIELNKVSSSSNTEGTASNGFDQVYRKPCVSDQETVPSGASCGDASIREAINALQLLMVKNLSAGSSDPATQSGLHQLLVLLSARMIEVKEAIGEFKTEAFSSLQEFQSTVESLKNFEMHLDQIQQETVAGKDLQEDLKNSVNKVSLAIEAENIRKKELEVEITILRKQLATKESNLEQLLLNLKNQEETLSTYSTICAYLNGRSRKLLKEAEDLLAVNSGIKDEG